MRLVPLVLLCIALGGCVAMQPHRYTRADPATVDCSDPSFAAVCATSVRESTPRYDLHFVEFDDQGLQFPAEDERRAWDFDAGAVAEEQCDHARPDCLFSKAWAYQITNLMTQLKQTASQGPISLVVFIHGWQHDARTDDENVQGFRRFLETAAVIEEQPAAQSFTHRPRRIVGVYVGWRGRSSDIPGLQQLTFWSRKTSALHVAEGSSRELFARLRGFKCVANSRAVDLQRSCNQPPRADDPVKVVLIGHSFGGLILYNSISGALIESMTHAFDASGDEKNAYWRFADLAVLINPAFEATRYTPLHRIASATRPDHYESPMLVTVTSTKDWATGLAFPAGRTVNTIFERTANAEEKAANNQTVGHFAPYFTHRLERTSAARPCDGWQTIDGGTSPTDVLKTLSNDLVIEFQNSKAFFEKQAVRLDAQRFLLKPDAWQRDFCGGVRLTSTTRNGNSPIWNINLIGDKDLMLGHNDIVEPLFIAFFRQLYMDTIYLRELTGDIPVSP